MRTADPLDAENACMFVRAKNVTRELTVVQFNTVARRVLICWKYLLSCICEFVKFGVV